MIPRTLSEARKIIDALKAKIVKPEQIMNSSTVTEVVEQFQRHRQLSGKPRSAQLDMAANLATGKPTATVRPTSARAALDRADMLLSKIAALKLPSSTPTRPTPAPKSYGQLLKPEPHTSKPSAPPPFKRQPDTRDTYRSATDSTLQKSAAGHAGAQFVAGAVAELQRRGWEKLPSGGWTRRA